MSTGSLLRNYWYAAARSEEVTKDAPFGRTMLNELIVLFCRADGGIAALEDRCPYCNAPLSMGRMIGGDLQCNYHGARFDGGGVYKSVPSQEGKIVPASPPAPIPSPRPTA